MGQLKNVTLRPWASIKMPPYAHVLFAMSGFSSPINVVPLRSASANNTPPPNVARPTLILQPYGGQNAAPEAAPTVAPNNNTTLQWFTPNINLPTYEQVINNETVFPYTPGTPSTIAADDDVSDNDDTFDVHPTALDHVLNTWIQAAIQQNEAAFAAGGPLLNNNGELFFALNSEDES